MAVLYECLTGRGAPQTEPQSTIPVTA
jgi:hypothetical protein